MARDMSDGRNVRSPAPAATPGPVCIGEYEELASLADGRRVVLRPIRPTDAAAHWHFVSVMTREDLYYRFFRLMSPDALRASLPGMTDIDYTHEMAFIATPLGGGETMGVVRAVRQAGTDTAEFAVAVRSDLGGLGLGQVLMEKIASYCRAAGLRRLIGFVLPGNRRMLRLALRLGYKLGSPGDDAIEASLDLRTS